MAKITEPRSGEERFDTLIRLLGVKDPQTRQEAAAMFCQVGKPAVPCLIHEALKPGRRSQHRVAILDVVQQIGSPLEFEDMFSLQYLLGHDDPGVRAKTEQVVMSLTPGGIPDSAEELALERILNPFLQPLPAYRPRRTRPSGSVVTYRMAKAHEARLKRAEERDRGGRS